MKKILITWWAWFVWSHLCRRLLKENNHITCLDNLYTWSKNNILDLLEDSNFILINHDIIEKYEWKFDEIYNLACPASPIHYQHKPIKTIKTSVLWAINVLNLALSNNAKILQASTSEVYGDPLINPQVETYWWNVNPVWDRSCYDEWKRMAETLFMDYNKEFKLNTRIIRIFNTYWPSMDQFDWRVVSNFIVQALKNEDITIYWDWTQTRSFQFVDDLVDWMIGLMNKTDYNKPVNIWTWFEFTINDFAKLILKLIPESNSKIVYKKLPNDDPKQRRADTTLANSLFWWEPKVELEKGLLETIKYFKTII